MVGTSQQDRRNNKREKGYGMESHWSEFQRTSKNRLRDDVSSDLRNLKVENWTYLVKDRKVWCKKSRRPKPTRGCSVKVKKMAYISEFCVMNLVPKRVSYLFRSPIFLPFSCSTYLQEN